MSYTEELRQAIEAGKEYPALARVRGQTGRVDVGFRLLKDGLIAGVRIVHATGFSLLDEAALRSVTRLGRFRPVPNEISGGGLNVVLPVEFRLLAR